MQKFKMGQAGHCGTTQSPRACLVVMVSKKKITPDDPMEKPKYLLCSDDRALEKVTKADSFPMPIVADAMDVLGMAR